MPERVYLYDGEHIPLTVANPRQAENWIMNILRARGTVTVTRPGRQPWRQINKRRKADSSRSGQAQESKA